jgi:Major Facilitator Superfamily
VEGDRPVHLQAGGASRAPADQGEHPAVELDGLRELRVHVGPAIGPAPPRLACALAAVQHLGLVEQLGGAAPLHIRLAALQDRVPVAAVLPLNRLAYELLVRRLHRCQYRPVDSSPLRDHDVRLIVGAVGVSALGDFLLWIPLTLRIQEISGSGVAMAGLFLALWTPLVVLAPVAGLVVDRREARGVLLVASLAQMVVAAALAFALDSVAAILVLAALLGTGFAFAQPAEFALVLVWRAARSSRRSTGSSRRPATRAWPSALSSAACWRHSAEPRRRCS